MYKLKTKKLLTYYFVSDILQLKNGYKPDPEGLVFLLNTGQVTSKITLADQFIASSMGKLIEKEIQNVCLAEYFLLNILKINLPHRLLVSLLEKDLNISTMIDTLTLSKVEQNLLLYIIVNIRSIRSHKSIALNQPFLFLESFRKEDGVNLNYIYNSSKELIK